MTKTLESKPCKKCGSTQGYYSNVRVIQTYDEYGEGKGYILEGPETKIVRCLNCGHKTTRAKICK